MEETGWRWGYAADVWELHLHYDGSDRRRVKYSLSLRAIAFILLMEGAQLAVPCVEALSVSC